MQREIQDRELRAQSAEYRLRRQLECEREQLTLKHAKALEDVLADMEALHLESVKLEQETVVIQNEQQALIVKLENIRRESKIVEEQLACNKDLERHQESLVRAMAAKLESEHGRQEELEVQLYE